MIKLVNTMGYKEILEASPYRDYLDYQLIEHLEGEDLVDAAVKYVLPDIISDDKPLKKKKVFSTKPTDVRLPARLASPLIPYPSEIRDLISGNFNGQTDLFHGHHKSQIDTLSSVYQQLIKNKLIPSRMARFDMDGLKQFARRK